MTTQRPLSVLLCAPLLLIGSSCASMVYQKRAACPESVRASGHVSATIVSDHDLTSMTDLSTLILGRRNAIAVRAASERGAGLCTLAVVPRITGYWLIGPLLPLPVIPLFGMAGEPRGKRLAIVLRREADTSARLHLDRTWVEPLGGGGRVPVEGMAKSAFDRPEPVMGTSDMWLGGVSEGGSPVSVGVHSAILVFDIAPHELGDFVLNLEFGLANGQSGTVTAVFRQRDLFFYDPIGTGIGWVLER